MVSAADAPTGLTGALGRAARFPSTACAASARPRPPTRMPTTPAATPSRRSTFACIGSPAAGPESADPCGRSRELGQLDLVDQDPQVQAEHEVRLGWPVGQRFE